jgi:hydrogenase maturation protein HypF
MAACLAENNWSGRTAIGLCFDGTGLGDDGAIWGGEILLGNYSKYDRKAFFEYMPLPGGDASLHKPYRIALAYMIKMGIPLSDFIPTVSHCSELERAIISKQISNNINITNTSSLGRLFDAVASLIGVCQEITYEGQAAIELENIIDTNRAELYEIIYVDSKIQLKDLFSQIISDLSKNIPNSVISSKFHNTISHLSLEICKRIRSESGTHEIALSGGVWQNKYLFEKTRDMLEKSGFTVFCHRFLPPNDGCISFGQAVIMGALTKE